ncbi:MAG TPA: glycosyltransferase family 9 protein [Bryobacteraceae bacterium]|nr:glycosyltransferase family 9 protein [Bryobacteraceae bacterium]
MSASTSCKERAAALLAAARRGVLPPADEIRDLGENCPGEFFRDVIEPLGDSFNAAQASVYERIMRVWIPARAAVTPSIPDTVDAVYVLSRVTLGADIKIVSPILDAMKRRFPGARIVFVANRKSAELFGADSRITHLDAAYPRSGPVSGRIAFAGELARRLDDGIVIDPDSRITQLGLLPVAPPERTFHFSSRSVGGETDNLSDLVRGWLRETFGVEGSAYIAPKREQAAGARPFAAVSLGVGENESKRVAGDFESRLIAELGKRFATIWVDRGAGGEEARRVTAAAAGAADRVRFWEGSFAGFASIISQSDLYVGYDSAGQHAAAAAGVPSVTIFAGAPSDRFRRRWAAAGNGSTVQIQADSLSSDEILTAFVTQFPQTG